MSKNDQTFVIYEQWSSIIPNVSKVFKPEKFTRLLELPVFYSVFCLYNKNNTFKQALMELTAPCFTVVEKASMAESTNQSCNN